MNVEPIDLLRLARAEFARYDRLADGGWFEMFDSARMARELVAEAICQMESATSAARSES